MRVIIQPDYQNVSLWAAYYIAAKINKAQPSAEKPYILGLPTGSSPLGGLFRGGMGGGMGGGIGGGIGGELGAGLGIGGGSMPPPAPSSQSPDLSSGET